MNGTRMILKGLLVAAATLPAFGQSLNIDINRTTGSGIGAPASSFAGAAGQVGTWNAVNASSSGDVTLLGLDGSSSACTITRAGGSGSSSSAGGSGDYGKLMADFDWLVTSNGDFDYTINGLDPGLYRVYLYMCLPGADGYYVDTFGIDTYYGLSAVVYLNNVSVGSATTYGPATPGVFESGKTHGFVNVLVGAGAPPLKIHCYTGASNHERAALNGIQVVKYEVSRLYVDKNATGLGHGRDWTNAFTNLQSAIALAKAGAGQITEIWVADGVYTPGNSRYTSFELPSGVKIYGGFAGGETQLSQRNLETNLAYLNGNIGDLIDQTDNSIHVVDASNTNSATRLDGFRIINGRADGSGDDSRGAGLFISTGGYLSVANCVFGSNHCTYEGGAVYTAGNSLPDFQYCTFENNTAGSYGGAIRNTGESHFWAVNSTFRKNTAGSNGGAINSTAEASSIFGCLFTGNDSGGNGGAIQVFGSGVSVDVRNCTIYRNDAVTAGGLSVQFSASASVSNCIFYANDDSTIGNSIEAEEISKISGGTTTVAYNLIWGWTAGGTGGTGNFSANPLFVDADGADNQLGNGDDDFRLQNASPCIDRGAAAWAPNDITDLDHDSNSSEMVPYDLAGGQRVRDFPAVTNVNSSALDMGAIEAWPVTPGDMNCDGLVNNFDIDAFVLALVSPEVYEVTFPNCNIMNGDANLDGQFNNFDIDPFVQLILGN